MPHGLQNKLFLAATISVFAIAGTCPAATDPYSEHENITATTPSPAAPAHSDSTFHSAAAFQAMPALQKIPAWKDLPKDPAARAAVWRQIVRTILAESETPMAAAGSCEAYATLWVQRLAQEGYPVAYAQTTGVGKVVIKGKIQPLDKIHVFVADRGLCENDGDNAREIIIDPTWTQFFEPGECLFEDTRQEYLAAGGNWSPNDMLTRLPKVFVGTRGDLIRTYQLYRSRLRSAQQSGVDPNTGTYEPASLASLHYSFGQNSALRTNLVLFPEGAGEK